MATNLERVQRVMKVRALIIDALSEKYAEFREVGGTPGPLDEAAVAAYVQAFYLSELADAHERINLEG